MHDSVSQNPWGSRERPLVLVGILLWNYIFNYNVGIEAIVDDHKNVSKQVIGYIKPVYPVLVENSIKVHPTNPFASLPRHDKFLVKERLHDPTIGFARVRLALKSCSTEVEQNTRCAVIVWLKARNYMPIMMTL